MIFEYEKADAGGSRLLRALRPGRDRLARSRSKILALGLMLAAIIARNIPNTMAGGAADGDKPPLAGIVLQPDGNPAAGAKIELGFTFPTYLNGRGEFQPMNGEARRAVASTDGRFSFPANPKNRHLVVIHPAGFAAVTPQDLAKSGEIRLEPWGRIQGVARTSGRPAPDIELTVHGSHGIITHGPGSSLSRSEIFGIMLGTHTDNSGHFTFDQVPAGEYIISQFSSPRHTRFGPIVASHSQAVTVKAGETTEINYGGTGRTVTGTAVTDPSGIAVDWQNDNHYLAPDNGSQSRPLRGAFPGDWQYVLQFDEDGRFRVADVPPGKYNLVIRITEAVAGQRFNPYGNKEIGSTYASVVVPQGPLDAPVDLGDFTVKITGGNRTVTKPLPPFEARTLDGKALRVSDSQGRYVVLVFWAAWCQTSIEAMKDFQAVYDAYKDNSHFAMIGVSLDESPAKARTFATAHQLAWATGWLDDPGRANLVDVYGVKGTPSVFLIDPKGNIAARDVPPANLPGLLKKSLAR